jgi:protein arginine N-methyltransferase 5
MSQALYLSVPTLIIPAPSLANRAYLPSYARAISNLLLIGGPTAQTHVSIRIPVSDPVELIGQGPALSTSASPSVSGNHAGSSIHAAGNAGSASGPTGVAQSASHGAMKRHTRGSSISTRPTSFHQSQHQLHLQQVPITPQQNMRVPSVATGRPASLILGGQPVQGDPSSTWEMWDCVRTLCGYHPRLSVSECCSSPSPLDKTAR